MEKQKQNFSDEITFKFISDEVLKAFEEDGKKYCRLTASSNGEDLVGDIMSEKALKQMETAAVGMLMFMNHKHEVPEDVFGSVIETTLEKKKAELVGGGNGDLMCLEYLVEVEETNDRAVKCWQMIQSGKKLGASVTVLVRDKKSNPKRKGGIVIDDVEYLETSIVGIPCNRQSWVNSAQKSLELAEKRAAKNAEEPLKTEGETNMETETIEKAVETRTEENKPVVVVIGAGNSGVANIFARSLAAKARVEVLNEQIAKGEKVEERAMPVTKGMFNDILEQEPTFWELCEILCEVKWELVWQKNRLAYLGQTDFTEILSAWNEALDEFKVAQTTSFKYWGEFPSAESEVLEMSLELEKTFESLLEVYQKTSDEEVQKQLHETGKRFLAIAKQLNLIPDSESAPTELIPTDEQIQKSAVYQELETKSNKEIADLTEKLLKTEMYLEITKAGLKAGVEAVQKSLRQPLDLAQGTSATS